MEPRKFEGYTIRYTLPRNQLMSFVGELHTMQHDMIEAVVAQKEKQGFPEAKEVIDYIMSK
jgi:hypothetical protein